MRGSRPHNPKRPYQVVDDIWFYKDKKGYYVGNVKDSDGKAHPVRLHRYVYEKHYGKIPKGKHIHHIDENKDNNDISNLALIDRFSHQSYHALQRSDESRENLNNNVRPYANKWHGSEEGVEWHKTHYQEYTQAIWNEKITKTCIQCGKEYETVHSMAKKSKYCSDACKYKYQWAHKVGGQPRICAFCGKEFLVKPSNKAKTCSKSCATSYRYQIAKSHLQE